MLVRAAAGQWGVPATECESGLHAVVHLPTRRQSAYGELALAASRLPVPKKEDVQLKPRTAWRYIGKDASLYDLEDICTGKAIYGMDARLEGMVYASIERPPVLGGKVKSYQDQEALRVAGVRQTVLIEPFKPPHGVQPLGGVAVIADNTWAAFQGRKKLGMVWDHGPNAAYNSDQFKKELQETARRPGKVVRNEGDVDAEFVKGGKTVEAEFYVPHLAHATMEPPVAVAEFRDGRVTAWAPTQNPQGVQEAIAQAVGIRKEDVTCHVNLLGGGFGRKSFSDFAVEAAVLSKRLGRPVKVVWSREDDIKFDYYLPVAAVYLKAALGSRVNRPLGSSVPSFLPLIPRLTAGRAMADGSSRGIGSKCRLMSKTSASKMAPPKLTSVSAGCGRWRATIILLPSSPLSTNWPTMPAGILWNTSWSCSDRPASSISTFPTTHRSPDIRSI